MLGIIKKKAIQIFFCAFEWLDISFGRELYLS